MKVGLIDVDGHNFPNLALMRISAHHKAQGDQVEWWLGDMFHYDIVYKSKVFSDAYSPDIPDPINADLVVKGGTGYAISLVSGKEVYDKAKDVPLPERIEKTIPDCALYPQYNFLVTMTSRGCPRGCPFCHVAAKEGRKAVRVADVTDFYRGQKEIKVLDANITALPEEDKRALLLQYRKTEAIIDFSQGLDIRLLNSDDIADLNSMRLKNVHFAWDNPKEDLTNYFKAYAEKAAHKPHGSYGTVYVLTNFNSTLEEDLERVYTLRALGFDPDIRIYNKPSAPREIRLLQRWCNNRRIFNSEPDFRNYDPRKG